MADDVIGKSKHEKIWVPKESQNQYHTSIYVQAIFTFPRLPTAGHHYKPRVLANGNSNNVFQPLCGNHKTFDDCILRCRPTKAAKQLQVGLERYGRFYQVARKSAAVAPRDYSFILRPNTKSLQSHSHRHRHRHCMPKSHSKFVELLPPLMPHLIGFN